MNLPAGDGRSTRSSFARNPIPQHLVPPQPHVPPPDATSADIYLPDSLRVEIPNAIRVSLPRRVSAWVLNYPLLLSLTSFFFQSAWDALKQKFVDEELEKLGVEENDTESSMPPHIDVSVSYTLCVFGSLPLIYTRRFRLMWTLLSSPSNSTNSNRPKILILLTFLTKLESNRSQIRRNKS